MHSCGRIVGLRDFCDSWCATIGVVGSTKASSGAIPRSIAFDQPTRVLAQSRGTGSCHGAPALERNADDGVALHAVLSRSR